MKILRKLALALGLAAATITPILAQPAIAPPATQPALPVDVFGFAETGINLTARNPSVRPGDDFYAHANGAWTGFVRERLGPTDA